MKTKNEVYVVVDTPKKAKKLKEVLDMFNEPIYRDTSKRLSENVVSKEYPIIHFYTEWTGYGDKSYQSKTKISIKELRNILAKEHLNPNAVVVCKIGDAKYIVEFDRFRSDMLYSKRYITIHKDGSLGSVREDGAFYDFVRYATPEEIALLEGKKDVLENVKDKVLFQDKIDYAKKSLEGVELPKLENKELVVGKWYKSLTCPKFLGIHLKKDRYGFDTSGVWFDNCNVTNLDHEAFINNLTEATPQEVESALIEEAKMRGYKTGLNIKSFVSGITPIEYSEIRYRFDSNILVMGGAWIFKNGKWATIIEQDKFAELKEAHKNGAVIQFKSLCTGEWTDVARNSPSWMQKYEYRIKPEEKPKVGDWVSYKSGDIRKVTEITIGNLDHYLKRPCGIIKDTTLIEKLRGL